jgi:hypothetical protein
MAELEDTDKDQQRKEEVYGRLRQGCQAAAAKAQEALQERQELEHALRERLQVAAAEAEQEAQDQGRHFAEQLPQYRRDADYWNQQKLSAQRSSNFAGARSHSSMHSKCLHLVALAEQHRISPVVGMPGQEPAAEDPDNRPPHAHSSEADPQQQQPVRFADVNADH